MTPARRTRAIGRFGWAMFWAFLASSAGLVGTTFAAPCGLTVRVAAQPAVGDAPLFVELSANVTGGVPSSYNWSFGDGSYWNGSGAALSSPLHRYVLSGSYTAAVLVGSGGCWATGSFHVQVRSAALTIHIVGSPSAGAAPLTVNWSATITGGSGTYTSVTWSFGDGSVGSGPTVRTTYSTPGHYLASATVTDSTGRTANASAWANVSVGPASDAGFPSGWPPLPTLGVGIAAAGVVAIAAVAYLRSSLSPLSSHGRKRSSPPLTSTAVVPGTPPTRAESGGPAPELLPPPEVPRALPETSPPGPPPTSAAPSGRGPGRSLYPRDALRLSQRVLVHIAAQGALGPDDIAPLALSQPGMAQTLQVSQNSLTNVLRRLVAAGALAQDLRHVSGRSRRLRVYRLTPRGEAIARDLRRRPQEPRSSSPNPGRDLGSK